MKSDQVHLLALVGATTLVAVTFVLLTALASIFVVFLLKSLFAMILQMLTFIAELFVAVVAAITSGATVTLSIVAAAGAAAVTFPASSIEARIGVSVIVSSAAVVASASAVMLLTSMKIDAEVAFAVVSAAATSVSFAAAWAVGVMSLIEKETQHVGMKMTSILDMVRRNNYRILKLLLKLQAGYKQRDLDIALLHAVKAGFLECTKVLLDAGANPDSRDTYDNSALLLACETGSFDIAKLLTDKGATPTLQHAGGRGTALHQAAKWGSDDCVRLLLSRSANPNAVDGLWRTPLMLAAAHAHQAAVVMRTLLAAGSDVNAVGTEQKTALHYAAARGLDPTELLEAGADASARDSAGNTTLHVAAAGGHPLVVRTLVDRCDPRAVNDQGRTALHLATARGDLRCLETIVDAAGPDCCGCPDANGNLPIWHAAHNGHYDATVFFIRANGPYVPDFRDPRGLENRFCGSSASVGCSTFYYRCDPHDLALTTSQSSGSNPLAAALEKRHMTVARALVIGGCCRRAELSDWLDEIRARNDAWTDENAEHLDWLDGYAHAPCELGHLCRLAIREVLGTRVRRSACVLPLPKKLQQYVLLDELSSQQL